MFFFFFTGISKLIYKSTDIKFLSKQFYGGQFFILTWYIYFDKFSKFFDTQSVSVMGEASDD